MSTRAVRIRITCAVISALFIFIREYCVRSLSMPLKSVRPTVLILQSENKPLLRNVVIGEWKFYT